MPINTLLHTLALPAMVALVTAIFSFGKPKAAPSSSDDELVPLPEANATVADDVDENTDDEGSTIPVLAMFSVTGMEAVDRDACQRVWNALSVPVRTDGDEPVTRFFAVTAFGPAESARMAVSQTIRELALDASERGYSVLLIDADVDSPSLHRLPPFQSRDSDDDLSPPGLTDFLRGDVPRLDTLLKLAWRTEGLLLLPAGTVGEEDELLTGGTTTDRLFRLATPLAELVLVLAPPLFSEDKIVRNSDLLPPMDGVLVAFPSSFSAASDTEAMEKLDAFGVQQVGGIVAPPVAFADNITVHEADVEQAPSAAAVQESEIPSPEVAPADILFQSGNTPAVAVPAARPSFLTPGTTASGDRPRGDARRSVPIDSVPVYTSARILQTRAPNTATSPIPAETSTMSTASSAPDYRPDISLELIPATDTATFLTLRADVGGNGDGPALRLELRTVASEAKRLSAVNPGTSHPANPPILTLEALTGAESSDNATVLYLMVRESREEGAAVLLEATLDTPDALRIKSGKASGSATPPVRFEVTTEPDDTARFRATVPPLGDAPAMFVDLERSTTGDGRWSRIVLRLA